MSRKTIISDAEKPKPVQDPIVGLLTSLLEAAMAGNVVGVGIAVAYADGDGGALVATETRSALSLLGLCSVLEDKVLTAFKDAVSAARMMPTAPSTDTIQ